MRRRATIQDRPKADQLPSQVVLPRNDVQVGHLVFLRGAARTTVVAEPALGAHELLTAHFEGPPAEVQANGGRVTVRPQHASLAELARTALLWGRAATTIRLSPIVPWAIAVQGGASQLVVNLRTARLSALQISGGANELLFDLPHPVGVVQIQIMGGARAVTLRRPPEVAVHVAVGEGGSRLVLDARYVHAIAGPSELVAGPATAANRYIVKVTGGANQLTVDSWTASDQGEQASHS